MTQIEHQQLVIVGYGPAGLGASLAAYESGLRGIAAFDPSKRIGAGGLDGLDILSNSKGSDFTELLPTLLPSAARLLIAQELSRVTGLVELTKAASLLEEVAQRAIEEKIVEVHREQVVQVVRMPNGYQVRTPERTVNSDWLVLAPGGEEVLLDELALRNLYDPLKPAFTSREVLANTRNEDLEELIEGKNRVAIVGDSHGAYSVAEKLLRNFPGIEIDVYKHSRTRPFFENVFEAEQYGYEITDFDQISAETGYVNRFKGIRGHARDLWFREQNGELEGRLRSLYDQPLSEIESDVAVIQATGYTARRVPLFDSSNRPLEYVTRPTKEGFAKIQEGVNGSTLPNAFAVGIGSSATDATTVYQKQARNAFEVLF
ncbi:MAG TPA: hypothetical protein PLT55_03730 [Acidimicrobiia bacterium]|nr:hypothetical protein [Acidimicrobiia bacterium]